MRRKERLNFEPAASNEKRFIPYLSQRGQDFIASFSGGYTGGDGDGVDRVPLLHQLWNHRHLKTPLFRVQIQHVDRKTTPGLQQIRQVHHVLFKNIFSRQTTRRQFHLVPGDQNRARMGYNTDQYTTHDQSRKTSRPLLHSGLLQYVPSIGTGCDQRATVEGGGGGHSSHDNGRSSRQCGEFRHQFPLKEREMTAKKTSRVTLAQVHLATAVQKYR